MALREDHQEQIFTEPKLKLDSSIDENQVAVRYKKILDRTRREQEDPDGENNLDAVKKKYTETLVYQENLSENSKFTINRYGIYFEVRVFVDGHELANLEIYFDGDDSDKGWNQSSELNIRHRLVATQAYGISGKDVLTKTENYFKALLKLGFIKHNTLYINAGQETVINWALKNSFKFKSEIEKQKYENIISNRSPAVRNVTDNAGKYPKEGYIFDEKTYDQWKSENEKAKSMGDKPYPALHYSHRFRLIKRLR